MKQGLSLLLSLGCCTLSRGIFVNSATAQVTPDGTTNSTVDANGNNFTINQGDRAGSNLFHSFDGFSVPNGGSAFFNNAADIANIFSRVTGGNISNIDGLIRANGAANLFLINPAGIIFGEGARLDIGGSFYGSSADSILFEDGEFSATDLDNPPLLTINAPIGLGFRDNPGDIINRSDLTERGIVDEGTEFERTEVNRIGLEVDKGRDIGLIGGNVSIENSGITAPGGRVTVGGLSQAGIVTLNEDGSFVFPEEIDKADVSLMGNPIITINRSFRTNQARISVVSNEGGYIDLNAHDLVLDGALLELGIDVDEPLSKAETGDINITASSISLDNSSNIQTILLVDAARQGNTNLKVGDLNLTADSIALKNNSNLVSAINSEKGILGDMNITANSISFDDSVLNFDNITDTGILGDLNLTADSISLKNKSLIQTSIQIFPGKGTVGNTNLIATDSIYLDDSTIVSFLDVDGKSETVIGNLNLTADSISLKNNSFIILESFNGDGILGGINLDANSIFIENKSEIFTQTQGVTNASDIQINATESIGISGIDSSISSQTGGLGNAGNITINTPELRVLDSSEISANNFITETFEFSSSGRLIRNILEQPSEGSGNAGTIDITANNITLEDRGGITALSSAGEGGNIQLKVDNLLSLRNNSEISTTAGVEGSPGNGGNININSKLIVAFPNGNSDITANAFDGAGGNITIFTEGVFGIEERSSTPPNNTNDIDASGRIDGIVEINTPDVNPLQVDTNFPKNLVEGEQTVAQACRIDRLTGKVSGLTVKGKGGIPPLPTEPIYSDAIIVNGKLTNLDPQVQSLNIKPIKTSQGDIYPARGIIKTEDGQVILTAYPTDGIDRRTPQIRTNCIQS